MLPTIVVLDEVLLDLRKELVALERTKPRDPVPSARKRVVPRRDRKDHLACACAGVF